MASRYNTVVCTATGWSRERPHCEVLLCPPVIDVNLKILTTVYDDEYTIGNVINFECKNPEHKLYGPSHIFCTSAGTWNTDPPTCKTPVCLPVKLDDSVVLSSPQSNEYAVGHILNIQCKNQNFLLNGPSELRCTSEGKWNTDPPTCTDSCTVNENEMRKNRIQLKYNQAPTVQHGEIVEFDCIPEHEIPNHRQLRVSCNGGLLVYPTCHRRGSCTVNENDMRNHGLRLKPNQARTVDHRAYVEFNCAPEYESSGYLGEYCWNGVLRYPTCYKSTCTVNENEMRNRGIQLKYNKAPTVRHNAYVEFDCAPGYESPYYSRLGTYCNRGVLEYPACYRSGSCTVNEDEMLNHGLQLKYNQARTVHHGYSVGFDCASGYGTLYPNNLRAHCNGGQLTYPTCHRTGSCTVNEDEMLNHGLQLKYNQARTVHHGYSVEFDCASGHGTLYPNNLRAHCNGGQLTYPTCHRTVIEQDCSAPPVVQNGDITGIRKLSYSSGSSVQYQCANDYELEGKAKISCHNGEWEKEPTCRVIEQFCSGPPIVQNGDITGIRKLSYTSDSSVQYQCANYYKLEGKANISCQDGKWEKEPICRVPCTATDAAMKQNNIRLKYKTDKKLYSEHLDTITFDCIKDYEISDTSLLRIQCLDGELNYPKCTKKVQDKVEKPCPQPPEVLFGELSEARKQSYASRSTVEFQCISYYKLQGKPKIKCQDGVWETPPVCLEPCIINEKYLQGNSTKTKENKKYWKHDEVVTFLCFSGFFPETGQLKSRCNNGELVYPKCVKRADKCDVNMTAINENHIVITSKHCKQLNNGQVCRIQQNNSIKFKCRHGFRASESTPLEGKCQNGVIEYPKCINTMTERTTIQPFVNTEVTDRRTF
ncbi:coagulation factor XIII B chain-like isoform X2 [Hyperolius riggenbachi]|uniref:coagulation factor XIII B chain-like isoform X2 n=1 Tax=Hyperolius riggenbachi TaxID=752182 RepID=UPI0035A267CE